MPKRLCLLVALLLTSSLAWGQERGISKAPSSSRAAKRLALVIGNSNYLHTSPLRNPANDAQSMSQVLKQLGFAVTALVDADQRTMETEIARFGETLRRNEGVGLPRDAEPVRAQGPRQPCGAREELQERSISWSIESSRGGGRLTWKRRGPVVLRPPEGLDDTGRFAASPTAPIVIAVKR